LAEGNICLAPLAATAWILFETSPTITGMARPPVVTLICWILIFIGGFSLFSPLIALYFSPDLLPALKNELVVPAGLYDVSLMLMVIREITNLVAGILMLKGRNWARLTFIGIWVVSIGYDFIAFHESIHIRIFPVLVLLICVICLFTPKANRFFKGQTETAH